MDNPMRSYLMSWNKSRNRWQKMDDGQMHYFYPDRHGLPATKEGSWQAANQFWRDKLAELNYNRKASHPQREYLAVLERREAWSRAHGDTVEADRLAGQRQEVEPMTVADDPPALSPSVDDRVETARLFGVDVPSDLDPIVREHLFGDGRLWQDRLKREQQTPEQKTIGYQFDVWVEGEQARAKTGEISPDRANNYEGAVKHFVHWLGRGAAVAAIMETTWRDFCIKLVRGKIVAGEWSESYAADVQRHTRRFIKTHLWESGTLDTLPRNLTNKTLAVTIPQRKKVQFTLDEVQTILNAATGKLRCFLLLMLNCGYTQMDISDLHPDEVDWQHGRITRKRSKTEKREDTPEVSYLLWPETFRLMQQYRSTDPQHVFLTNGHKPYVIRGQRCDKFMSLWRRLKKETGITKPPKSIRKTSSQLLEDHRQYRDFAQHFLGHAPVTIKDKHYTDPSGKLFDAAVRWLGKQYGLVE